MTDINKRSHSITSSTANTPNNGEFLLYQTEDAQTRRLDSFLKLNEQDILNDAGRVSAEAARLLAEAEFDKFQASNRRVEAGISTSDFDHFVDQQLLVKKNKETK